MQLQRAPWSIARPTQLLPHQLHVCPHETGFFLDTGESHQSKWIDETSIGGLVS